MAAKLFINNTGFEINGNLIVRSGNQPGVNLNSQQFVLKSAMGSQQTVNYGDNNNVYVNGLELSSLANGGYIVSNQLIVTRGGTMDDLYNTNDTITITLSNQSFVISTSNTWAMDE